MGPADSDRVSRARPYSGTTTRSARIFAYGAFTLYGVSFHPLPLTRAFVTPRLRCGTIMSRPTTPGRQHPQIIAPTWFRLFPFRSPLLRESRFLSLPRATKMFQFARYLHRTYGFSVRYPRITTGGFPHSEILGSTLVRQLPEAYRSHQRPSSAPGTKAFTVCPCSLDS